MVYEEPVSKALSPEACCHFFFQFSQCKNLKWMICFQISSCHHPFRVLLLSLFGAVSGTTERDNNSRSSKSCISWRRWSCCPTMILCGVWCRLFWLLAEFRKPSSDNGSLLWSTWDKSEESTMFPNAPDLWRRPWIVSPDGSWENDDEGVLTDSCTVLSFNCLWLAINKSNIADWSRFCCCWCCCVTGMPVGRVDEPIVPAVCLVSYWNIGENVLWSLLVVKAWIILATSFEGMLGFGVIDRYAVLSLSETPGKSFVAEPSGGDGAYLPFVVMSEESEGCVALSPAAFDLSPLTTSLVFVPFILFSSSGFPFWNRGCLYTMWVLVKKSSTSLLNPHLFSFLVNDSNCVPWKWIFSALEINGSGLIPNASPFSFHLIESLTDSSSRTSMSFSGNVRNLLSRTAWLLSCFRFVDIASEVSSQSDSFRPLSSTAFGLSPTSGSPSEGTLADSSVPFVILQEIVVVFGSSSVRRRLYSIKTEGDTVQNLKNHLVAAFCYLLLSKYFGALFVVSSSRWNRPLLGSIWIVSVAWSASSGWLTYTTKIGCKASCTFVYDLIAFLVVTHKEPIWKEQWCWWIFPAIQFLQSLNCNERRAHTYQLWTFGNALTRCEAIRAFWVYLFFHSGQTYS